VRYAKYVSSGKALCIAGALFFSLLLSGLAYAAAPTVTSISPTSGLTAPDIAKTFAAKYSDADGWANIKEVYLLINTSSTVFTNTCYLYYDQNSNLLYIRNDANTAWLGGYSPASNNIIENSYIKVNCMKTTVTGTTTTLTVNWDITFKSAYSGKTYNTYLKVIDDTGAATSWVSKGTYTVDITPELGEISPSLGAGKVDTVNIFTTTYSDADGWQNIQSAYLFINTSATSTANGFYGRYDPGTNKLYCYRGGWTGWVGGYAPGSSNVIKNSYTTLDCSKTTIQSQGNILTINWAVSFTSSFTGTKNTYLSVKDNANYSKSLTQKGKWIIDNIPPTGSVAIENNSKYTCKAEVTLTLSATDSLSGVDKAQVSNDGVTWSDPETYSTTNTWSLIDGTGEKTVYVKFIDKAGNESAVYADSILLYPGTLIDTNGGEVASTDGKARLIIPNGALLEPTPINIIPLDISKIENQSPENYSFLIAIQCDPPGLVFQKPVELIFKLDKPEVPGTLVRLGRRSETDTEFIPLGRTSPVAQDGVTLNFILVTFSSYAGLSSMISQGAPIGAGVQVPLPDMLTGAFGHSIPITLPPGRKNMQPNLSLQYRSSNPNSWVGFGWSLNPGYIIRSTKLGPALYDDIKDTFIFVTDSGSSELVHLIDNLYQAKIESNFAKFYKETDDSWKVIQKDGAILLFGQNADSKETSPSGTFLWNLTKITDNNKNYIELSYIKDGEKSYLSQIYYTGNETTRALPLNTVEFTTEDRTDIFSNYISTSKVTTAKRLNNIQVKQQGSLVWEYELQYEYSGNTKRSLLRSITQKAADGAAYPAKTFTYQGTND